MFTRMRYQNGSLRVQTRVKWSESMGIQILRNRCGRTARKPFVHNRNPSGIPE